MERPRVCVLGLGYIGLPTASLLATKGYSVLGIDIDPEVVETINQGDIHIKEPELDILVRSAVNSGNLRASTEPDEADVFILAVPTPFEGEHQPDMSYIRAATTAIAPVLRDGDLVILESTSPVCTTEQVAEQLQAERSDLVEAGVASFRVAHCPERVLPGHILRELIENDRIVGGVDPESTRAAADFYRGFVSGEVIATDARTAEMTKLVENSFRDVNIAFANELSVLAHKHGINVWELIRLANHHPRVDILRPGAGVGGHCLAVDPWFIVSGAPEQARLIRTAREVNDGKADWVVQRILDRARRFKEPVVAVLGLAYKPDIDDLRESPALAIARRLHEQVDGEVLACEPNLRDFDEFPLHSLESCLGRADIVAILVAHREFQRLDPELLKDRVVIDAAGVL